MTLGYENYPEYIVMLIDRGRQVAIGKLEKRQPTVGGDVCYYEEYIQDAGNLQNATRVVKLLNEDHERTQNANR